MVKFELLSPNLLLMLNQVLTNENLVKYLYYNEKNPLSQPNLADPSILMFENLFPTPFDTNIQTDDNVQLRIFYLSGDMSKMKATEDMEIFFDIICAKSLWLINDGTPKIRPYEIISEVATQFDNNSIGTLGKLHFTNFHHLFINTQFDGIRLFAKMHTYHVN